MFNDLFDNYQTRLQSLDWNVKWWKEKWSLTVEAVYTASPSLSDVMQSERKWGFPKSGSLDPSSAILSFNYSTMHGGHDYY